MLLSNSESIIEIGTINVNQDMQITTYLDITDFYPDCLGEKFCGSLGRPSNNWKEKKKLKQKRLY